MSNVGFYPTTQLNPATTTIGSNGNFQSIMSYIYGQSTYEFSTSAGAIYSTTSGTAVYTGYSISITPTETTSFLIFLALLAQHSNPDTITAYIAIDTNAPPATGAALPSTATNIVSCNAMSAGQTESFYIYYTNGVFASKSGNVNYTIDLGTTYYLTVYMLSSVSGTANGGEVWNLIAQFI